MLGEMQDSLGSSLFSELPFLLVAGQDEANAPSKKYVKSNVGKKYRNIQKQNRKKIYYLSAGLLSTLCFFPIVAIL